MWRSVDYLYFHWKYLIISSLYVISPNSGTADPPQGRSKAIFEWRQTQRYLVITVKGKYNGRMLLLCKISNLEESIINLNLHLIILHTNKALHVTQVQNSLCWKCCIFKHVQIKKGLHFYMTNLDTLWSHNDTKLALENRESQVVRISHTSTSMPWRE